MCLVTGVKQVLGFVTKVSCVLLLCFLLCLLLRFMFITRLSSVWQLVSNKVLGFVTSVSCVLLGLVFITKVSCVYY